MLYEVITDDVFAGLFVSVVDHVIQEIIEDDREIVLDLSRELEPFADLSERSKAAINLGEFIGQPEFDSAAGVARVPSNIAQAENSDVV